MLGFICPFKMLPGLPYEQYLKYLNQKNVVITEKNENCDFFGCFRATGV